MLIDMHTHTLHYSMDSGLSLQTLVEKAKAAELHGVCLTEHNTVFKNTEMLDKYKDSGVTLFRGMEVGTDLGHVLAFGLTEYTLDMMYFTRLREVATEKGAFLVLAHPTRETELGSTPKWLKLREQYDAVEACNGSDSPGTWNHLLQQCLSLGIPTIGGSDAHSYGPIGSCATEFSDELKSDSDLLEALKSGKFRAVVLNNADKSQKGNIPAR